MEPAVEPVPAVIVPTMPTATPPGAAATDDVAGIVRDYDAFARQQDPVRAAQHGDAAAKCRWPDNSPDAVETRRLALQRFYQRLAAVTPDAPGTADGLNHELLADRVATALDALRFDEERIPFISGDGFYTTADYAALNTVLADETDAEAWLERLSTLPAYYRTETANMARGIATGFTQPQATVERAIADVRG